MRPTQSSKLETLLPCILVLLIVSGCWSLRSTNNQDEGRSLSGQSEHPAKCLPTFPDHAGWFGGDAAYSVPLPDTKGRSSLWLFGDSFVKRRGGEPGRTYPFIHNSIGLSHCDESGNFSLETFWQRSSESGPRAFFTPDADASWVRDANGESANSAYYWPFDGFIAYDALFIGLLRVVDSEPRGPFNLPFRLAGMDLARIENYRDQPKDWEIQLSTLSKNKNAFPGAAFVETPSHLYAFSFFGRDDGTSPRILSRIRRSALGKWQKDLSSRIETWSKDSTWQAGFDPENAMILMSDSTSEMSVHFDEERERWIAIYTDTLRKRNPAEPSFIFERNAPALTGPWSKPHAIAKIPETDPATRSESDTLDAENLFCYAGKAHPQFSSSEEILLTYVCSLYAREDSEALLILEKLAKSPRLYRPRAIVIKTAP